MSPSEIKRKGRGTAGPQVTVDHATGEIDPDVKIGTRWLCRAFFVGVAVGVVFCLGFIGLAKLAFSSSPYAEGLGVFANVLSALVAMATLLVVIMRR